MIRYIIVNHENPSEVLLNSLAILILIAGLMILELKNSRWAKKKIEKSEVDFEL